MKILKKSLLYLAYTFFNIVFSTSLIYLKFSERNYSKLAESIHYIISLIVGSILGIIATTLFLLVKYFILKKNTSILNTIVLQIVLLILSCLIVHEIHQILEFDLDIL